MSYKIVTLGLPSIGRSTFFYLLAHRVYNRKLLPTRSVQTSVLSINGKHLVLWDIPCQARMLGSIAAHLPGAQAVVIACSAANKKSFHYIDTCYAQVQSLRARNPRLPLILLVTQCDAKREVSHDDICEKAQQLKAVMICETSAEANKNVTFFSYELERIITASLGSAPMQSKLEVICYGDATPTNSPAASRRLGSNGVFSGAPAMVPAKVPNPSQTNVYRHPIKMGHPLM